MVVSLHGHARGEGIVGEGGKGALGAQEALIWEVAYLHAGCCKGYVDPRCQ